MKYLTIILDFIVEMLFGDKHLQDALQAPDLPPQAPLTPNPDPMPTPAPTARDLLTEFCTEIQTMEGWAPGTTSYTHNNPGNLRCTPGQKANWNALATGQVGGFCVFKSPAIGMIALRNVTLSCAQGKSPTYNAAAQRLGLKSSANLNLDQYFVIRDPGSDGNDPRALAQRFGHKLGVDPATFQMSQLLTDPSLQ